jgi:hypothetical protein
MSLIYGERISRPNTVVARNAGHVDRYWGPPTGTRSPNTSSGLYALDIKESGFRAPQPFSYPLFERIRAVAADRVAATSRVARMYGRLSGEGEQDITRVQFVSGEFFGLLSLTPAQGRSLTPADNLTIGTHRVAVVSHAFWQRRLGGVPTAIGRTIDVNGTHLTVVGVAPGGFNGLWLESPR